MTGFRNRGVEALVCPILAELAPRFDDPEVVVFTGSPEYDRRRPHGQNVRFRHEGTKAIGYGRLSRRLLRLGIDLGKTTYPGWVDLESSDLLIVTGGDVFSSEYGDWSFSRHLLPMQIAKRHKIPFVLFAQSIGPFATERHKISFIQTAQHASSISVREDRTYAYLTNELALPANLVNRVSDPAFLLGVNQATADRERGLSNGRLKVSVSISEGISDWTGVSREFRLSAWAILCNRIVAQWDADIVLIPHVQEPYADDTIACTDVWKATNYNSRVRVYAEDFSASEFKGIISSCDMVIAERMHAGIAGLSTGVCTSLIAYSVKARGIMEEMVGAELCSIGALIEGAEFEQVDAVWDKLSMIWMQRVAISNRIQQRLELEKARAMRGFECLSGLSSRNKPRVG